MEADFINDLIDRLITAECSGEPSSQLDWVNDECVLDYGQNLDQIDAASSSSVVYRVQRLPKLQDRRQYLIIKTSDADEEEKEVAAGKECVRTQLPYSTCLTLVNERQRELFWIGDTSTKEKDQKLTFTEFVRHVCHRLFRCPFINVRHRSGRRNVDTVNASSTAIDYHPDLLIPDFIIETDSYFYAVTPVSDSNVWVTLWDAATFSPHVLRESPDRLLFVVYQLLSTLVLCQQEAEFLLPDLRLDSVQINVNDLWLRLDLWRYLQYQAKDLTLPEDGQDRWTLGVWSDQWTHGALSNFDYLNILNTFAGRRHRDPYYHPIFPWVCDFTRDPLTDETNGGWRDLTKTKFRLTKGDQQLEQTFAGQQGPDGTTSSTSGHEGLTGRSASISGHGSTTGLSLPPHHVNEFLSDIGYYAYKSRRTQKSVLCRHVRHRWVPEEYPSSLVRLYQWTPDEAVPEFYSDPDIFTSIHPDLPDLELPTWLYSEDQGNGKTWERKDGLKEEKKDGLKEERKDGLKEGRNSGRVAAEKFIKWHVSVLESDHVSERLHSWIDLVFGYQLTGEAAVQAKNVQLHLVDRADRLANTGVVQLFTKPHPRRNVKAKRASASSASMDEVMNPLYDMEHSIAQKAVTPKTSTSSNSSSLPLPVDAWKEIRACQVSRKACPLVRECLTNLAVLITELCYSEGFRQLPKHATAGQRLQVAKRVVFNGYNYMLPRCVRSAIEILIDPDLSEENLNLSPAVDPATLCPGLILQPIISLIPFPYWVAPLYDCFRRVKALDTQIIIEKSKGNVCASVDVHQSLESAEKKVRDVAKLLPLILPHMSMIGVEMLARMTKYALFLDPFSRVMATWLLWSPLAQALGPELSEKHFLDCLLHLYDVDTPCSAKFLKLYHRTFLLQLSVRLGMQRMLKNFIHPLVEAAAGERDGRLIEDEVQYWNMVIHRQEERRSDDGTDDGPGRQLVNFSLPNIPEAKTAIDGSPLIERKCGQEDSDSVQFPLEVTDEGGPQTERRDSSSLDLDPAATDGVSIRSSESGFSASGGAAMSLSFTSPKSDPDEGQEGQSTAHHSAQQRQCPLISEVAEESLLWLSHRLGPLLTARYVTSNLLRMLALCYSTDRLEPVPGAAESPGTMFTSSWYPVLGDTGADKVLHCLEEIAMIYGEHMILRHYFAYAGELIAQALRRLTPNMEMAVLACVALIRRLFPYLTHEQLMENLKDHTFIDTLLFPLIRAASSVKVTFSCSASRTTLTWKLAECLYWLGVRVGSENVKTYLFVLVQRFFCTYDILYRLTTEEEVEQITSLEKSTEWSDAAFVQLKATFTPVLACRMMDAFGSLCGKQYLQLSISNSDLLAKMCLGSGTGYDNSIPGSTTSEMDQRLASSGMMDPSKMRELGTNDAEVDLVCKRLKHSSRKLKGTWLAYWEHELGRNPKDIHFNFKHMKLQSFVGHSGPVRKIYSLDNENSFFSAGQDKTVKLWSLRSTGDGGARTSCQFSYKSHRRSLLDLAFVESLRLVASVDGSVHIWDPFMGVPIREFEFGDSSGDQATMHQQVKMATVAVAASAPSTSLLVAGTFNSLKFLDVRQAKWAQEFTLCSQRNQSTCGPVRAICIDPSDRYVAVGHGLGHISSLDLRTGRLLGQVKLCETDIFAISAYDKDTFIVCPFDQPVHLIRARDCSLQCRIPGTPEAVTFARPFYRELICAMQPNRLRFYTSLNSDATFTDWKLRADVFAGAISSLYVLPLNRLLLLGSTTGNIELLC